MMNWKAKSKSKKVFVEFDNGREELFTAGGRRRVVMQDDNRAGRIVYVNGEVELADGTKAWAILCFDETSSGEHWDTMVWMESGKVIVSGGGFAAGLGKSEAEVYPYRYKYHVPLVDCHDHHVGADGWSTEAMRIVE